MRCTTSPHAATEARTSFGQSATGGCFFDVLAGLGGRFNWIVHAFAGLWNMARPLWLEFDRICTAAGQPALSAASASSRYPGHASRFTTPMQAYTAYLAQIADKTAVTWGSAGYASPRFGCSTSEAVSGLDLCLCGAML
jgi:hypothetical protein